MKKIAFIFLLLPGFLSAQIITTIAGSDAAGYSGDGMPATNAQLNRPLNIKIDHSGNIYVADFNNSVIRKINTSGIITTVVGNISTALTCGYSGDGGQATAAELCGITDVAFDKAGNLYLSDNVNAVIRKVDTAGIISTIAGTIGGGFGGDNGPATNAQLSDPFGLVFDTAGNLYFSDGGNHRIRKINTSGIISTIAGTGTPGDTGDGGPATNAELRIACWLAMSASNELYIPDCVNDRVRKIDSLGIITTVAGNGMSADTGDGGPATAASISGCQAIVFDDSGNYFISNFVSCSIRKVNTAGIITTIAGNDDSCGFGGDGGYAILAQIQNDAVSSAIDASGNLYFADSKNNRIRKVTYDTATINKVNEVNKTPQNVTIYPNPAHDEITIKAIDKIESIEILNLIGQYVYKQSYGNTNNAEIPISNLANGVYFVKVNGVYAGKFVKE